MLTEKQELKLNKLSEIYNNGNQPLNEINQQKLIEILKACKWNMTDSTIKLGILNDEISAEKNRILNLPKNVVRRSAGDGYEELWVEFYKCPSCENSVLLYGNNYCSACGTKLDWSEFNIE